MAISPAVEASPATAAVPSAKKRPRPASVLDAIGALVVFACFAVKVVPQTGGRDGNALLIGLVTTTLAFVATRSWRHLRPRLLILLASLPAAALLVCLVTPAGGAGFKDAAGYAYAAVTFGFVAALARTPARRTMLVIGICALGLDQFGRAFLPWWGGEDASRPMIGTFYWHNQFGAYMLAIALAAGVAGVFGAGVLRQVGLMVAPVSAAAVGLSASRGCVLLLAAGWLTVGVLAAIQSAGRGRALLRWGLVAISAAAVSTALTSSMFFPNSGSGAALSGVETRNNSEQTAEQNLKFRVSHDKAAIAVFREHPLVGVGYQSYAAAASRHLPFGLTRSPYVHNGYLQAAVDGGVLLLVPLMLGLAAGLVSLARDLGASARSLSRHAPQVACAAGAAALLAHSAIDLDWTYPALTALLAALLAAAVSIRSPVTGKTDGPAHQRPHRSAAGLVPAVAALAIIGIVRFDRVQTSLRLGDRGATADVVVQRRLDQDARLVPDGRLVMRALNLSVPAQFSGRLDVSNATAVAVLERSAPVGGVNATVQMQRAQILVALGRGQEGVRLAESVVDKEAAMRPFLISYYAETLAAVGRRGEAETLLLETLTDPRLAQVKAADQLIVLTGALARLAGPSPAVATACALSRARSQIAAVDPSATSAAAPAGEQAMVCPGPPAAPTALGAPSR